MNKDDLEGGARTILGKGEQFVGDETMKNGGTQGEAMSHVQSAIDSAKEAVSSGAQAAAGEIGALQDQVGKLAQSVAQLLQDQASSARDQVVGAVGKASDTISQSATAAQDTLTSIETDVGARIKGNPWSAVVLAVLVGVLIGKMTS
jgi:ElaB/YqjD/DUF883 family membrane-anchored ribosome-binding protein